jgi:hypothetical protein
MQITIKLLMMVLLAISAQNAFSTQSQTRALRLSNNSASMLKDKPQEARAKERYRLRGARRPRLLVED